LGTYALGFWYSGKLVADSLQNDCIAKGNCLTGGTILSTFFSVIMGAIALGQIAPPATAFFAGINHDFLSPKICGRQYYKLDSCSQSGGLSYAGYYQ
jgi:hypothetical protein